MLGLRRYVTVPAGEPQRAWFSAAGWLRAVTQNRSEKESDGGVTATASRKHEDQGPYLRAIFVDTWVKVLLSCEPRPDIAVMAATAMSAAMRPYSIAVAPLVSFSILGNFVTFWSPGDCGSVHSSGPSSSKRRPVHTEPQTFPRP